MDQNGSKFQTLTNFNFGSTFID